MRTFELGDLVVSGKFGVGNIDKVDDYYIRAIFYTAGLEIIYDFDDILTIRKPRHGSKEARDIVAMLGCELRKEYTELCKLCASRDGYWRQRKEGTLQATRTLERRFYKAKSMLKVCNHETTKHQPSN